MPQAAGSGYPDRAGRAARQHHRLCLSRLVLALRLVFAARSPLHRQPLRLARGLWRDRCARLHQLGPLLALAGRAGMAGRVDLEDRAGGFGRSGTYSRCCWRSPGGGWPGQFVVFTFMGSAERKFDWALGLDAIGIVFGIYGLCGLAGHLDRHADRRLLGTLPNVLFVYLLWCWPALGVGCSAPGAPRADGGLRRGLGRWVSP